MTFNFYTAIDVLDSLGADTYTIIKTAKNDDEIIDLAVGLLYLTRIKSKQSVRK